MKKMENIKELYLQAQRKIEKIGEFYEKYKDTALSPLDFKVHGVASYMFEEMKKDYPLAYEKKENVFDCFCETEFGLFTSENSQVLAVNIGRTSKFRLVPKDATGKTYFAESYAKKDEFITEVFYKRLELDCSYSDVLYLSNKLNIIFDKGYESRDIVNALNSIIEFDINEFFAECINFYNNLQYFKDNQVEIFKDYCEQKEDEIKI